MGDAVSEPTGAPGDAELPPAVAHDLAGCLAAHRRLEAQIAGLSDDEARLPCRLPGWTVGHLLTHLARNADSVIRRLAAAARDEVVDQYPGGFAGRAAEIEAGVGRPAAELIADVLDTNAALEAEILALPVAAWERPTRGVTGLVAPARAMVWMRWREVEIHLVDLGRGTEPGDWPPELVERLLPEVIDGLAGRADPAALLAWGLGRGPAPDLAPW